MGLNICSNTEIKINFRVSLISLRKLNVGKVMKPHIGNNNKNQFLLGANVMNMYAKYQLYSLMALEEVFGCCFFFCCYCFFCFFFNLPFMLPLQPTKLSDFDKIHLNHIEKFKKHFV